MSKDIKCPYCDHEFDDAAYTENETDTAYELQCPNCEQFMFASWSIIPHFITSCAPCLNGGDHKLEEILGSPAEYYKYKRRCAYCEEIVVIDEVKDKESIEAYFKELKKGDA